MTTKARQLPPSADFVDETLEAESPMRLKASTTDPDRLFVQFQKDAPLLDGHCLSIDAGRRKWKIGYWKSPRLLIIDRLSTDLAVVENTPNKNNQEQPGGQVRKGFLARNKEIISEKNRITITYQNQTYATGLKAQKLKGERGLGQKKTRDLLQRVLCALTLHGITSGKVYLNLAIPFEGVNEWETQEAEA